MNKKMLVALLCIATLSVWACFEQAPKNLSGKITDDAGKPLAGVIISEVGENNQTISDSVGWYELALVNERAKIRFYFGGYQLTELAVVGGGTKNLSMKPIKAEEDESRNTNSLRLFKSDGLAKVGSLPYTPHLQKMPSPTIAYDQELQENFNREGYEAISENGFKIATDNPLSTFSIDVDGASYSNTRRYIEDGSLPPTGAVRIEELINYFHYDYLQPLGEHPFGIHTEMGDAPWNPKHKIIMVGLQGKKIPVDNLPASNMVFLIDVSGSMADANKLPLVKASLKMLTEQLRPNDRVAIVVYAGAAGLVLPPTKGSDKKMIIDALENLNAGGSTAGGEGIKLAYKTAREYFAKDGNNRVILCSDGDFNVGQSSDDELVRLIEKEREGGVFLSVLGYGMGNYQDAKMQKLANKGNGNHSYIDGMSEARKVLVNEFGGTLFTIAKDVKLQVEFNPEMVGSYRLIGYENRLLNKEDFNDDKKDAGELGSGHTVTALYEIIPVGVQSEFAKEVDPLKYGKTVKSNGNKNEWATIKFRYKEPTADKSKLLVETVKNEGSKKLLNSDNFRFAISVAEFGMLLRQSEFKQNASWQALEQRAKGALGTDKEGYRRGFVELVSNAKLLAKQTIEERRDEGMVRK